MSGAGGRTKGAGGRTSGARRGDRSAGRVQPARRIAHEVLVAVREADAYANLLLPVLLRRAALRGADAALATELTYGTLRRRGYYDAVIELAAGRAADRIDPPLLDLLRLGCHQLLSTRVAAHAAVDEAVSLAREVSSRGGAGFVNGVLRTVARTEADQWRDRVAAAHPDADDRRAVLTSHPAWIVAAFRDALAAGGAAGAEPDPGLDRALHAELDALLAADDAAPRVGLAALPGLAEPAELGEATPHSPVGAVAAGGDPAAIPAVAEGRARVQDEGSQLAALALSRARPVAAGERWLDLCAGPGGKAALLAAEAARAGAVLVANEVVPARAGLVRRALSALPSPPEVTERDGRGIGDAEPERYDRILLDAPCTGLGALRRRPEARWRRTPDDVDGLVRLQGELLRSAVAALKPGGVLAYVTCSPHLAETRGVVDAALRDDACLALLDTRAVLDGLALRPLDADGAPGPGPVQLWPHRHGTDAMFVCLLGLASASAD